MKEFYVVTGRRLTFVFKGVSWLYFLCYRSIHYFWVLGKLVFFCLGIFISRLIYALTYVPRVFFLSLLNWARVSDKSLSFLVVGFSLLTLVSFSFVYIPMGEFALYIANLFQWIGVGRKDRLIVMPYIFLASSFILTFKFLSWYSSRFHDFYEDVKYDLFCFWFFLNEFKEQVLLDSYHSLQDYHVTKAGKKYPLYFYYGFMEEVWSPLLKLIVSIYGG